MVRLLFVTATPAEAPGLVRTLVEERLVACGNITSGVRSIYRWDGVMQDDEEVVIFMETTTDRLEAAVERTTELHSYSVPKIVVFTPEQVAASYAAWVRDETATQS